MKFSELLALSEASTGYVGGTYVDEMPHLTLEECVSSLTESILADQISLYESNMKQNDSLVRDVFPVYQGQGVRFLPEDPEVLQVHHRQAEAADRQDSYVWPAAVQQV